MGEKMCQIPAFGSWHYREPVVEPGLTRASFFGEEDLFKVPVAMPVDSAYLKGGLCRRKVRKRSGVGLDKQCSRELMQRKKGNAGDFAIGAPSSSGAPKAVDEDLYKIPQELLYQKPKRKRLLKNLLSGCLGLSCIP
ncbi:hypothetical protein IEQ34_007275 [Dendrobium chrysotoxum]|uniref:Uncharacterized protein n=1 Tax=Dendrobium chrysotoxum TaxID=161865 RepID=A0AAV7GSQ2_DENCH|nr:hypothetical protein IEQ34_007275 [Dendrobium chrysotoxum]